MTAEAALAKGAARAKNATLIKNATRAKDPDKVAGMPDMAERLLAIEISSTALLVALAVEVAEMSSQTSQATQAIQETALAFIQNAQFVGGIPEKNELAKKMALERAQHIMQTVNMVAQ